ncbi:exopolyphosphatase [Kineococcus gynurae]|uniref:Exopolyphosphatase n=1 Tax=Kineococcus gynurae TaxID=452979 RepID=A0ABV5LNQ3_9ACTN
MSATRRVAAIDCGTNSLRLLVADVAADGTARDLVRSNTIVRLGQGVDATGAFAPEALTRTFAACDEVAATLARLGVGPDATRFVATSASRDVSNRAEFVAGVLDRLGVEPDVVSGTEEARLSFVGATRELVGSRPDPFCVVDLGGGSTEFVLGRADVEASLSVDVGSVRLTERHLHDDPPTPEQVAAARADVAAALDRVEEAVPLARTATLVGVAGTVTTLTAAVADLPAYEPGSVHGREQPIADVRATCAWLLALPRAERRTRPWLHPGRVDVIGAGALVWDAVLERFAGRAGLSSVLSSEHDILDGIARSVVERADRS